MKRLRCSLKDSPVIDGDRAQRIRVLYEEQELSLYLKETCGDRAAGD